MVLSILRNQKGHVIGRILKWDNETVHIQDAQGRFLGRYRIDMDKTFDSKGMPICFGNCLTHLLRERVKVGVPRSAKSVVKSLIRKSVEH